MPHMKIVALRITLTLAASARSPLFVGSCYYRHSFADSRLDESKLDDLRLFL